MKEFTDEQLIEMHKKGDHTEFEVIYARYKNMIRSLARGLFLVGGDNEDLMQEGVLGLLNAVNTFNGATSFSTYAYTCIKNSMLTAVNSAQSKRNTPLNTSVPIATQTDEFLNLYLDPEDEIIGKESERELMQKITQGLSLFESTVLKLFLEGLSYVEIGEKLNKTAKSIDNALQRIKRKISNILA